MAAGSPRFLAWNILHGGGARRTPEIALAILAHQPDIVVLSEFRAARGSAIRAALADRGLDHQFTTGPRDGNGMLVASRCAVNPAPARPDLPGRSGRFIECTLPGRALRLAGVHAPDENDPSAQLRFWNFLVRFARAHAHEPCLVLGDFNTGRRGQDGPARSPACEPLLGTFCSLGFRDAWRLRHGPDARAVTWAGGRSRGRRIDGAYLSAPLADSLQDIVYSGVEREAGLSDHSPLVLDLNLSTDAATFPGPAPGGLFPAHKRAGGRG